MVVKKAHIVLVLLLFAAFVQREMYPGRAPVTYQLLLRNIREWFLRLQDHNFVLLH